MNVTEPIILEGKKGCVRVKDDKCHESYNFKAGVKKSVCAS